MPSLIPSPSDPNSNPLDQMQTQEGATAALNTALAATPEPHRSVISATLMLMLRQQTCLIETLEKQPLHVAIEGKVLWDPKAVPSDETYFKSAPILALIKDFRGE